MDDAFVFARAVAIGAGVSANLRRPWPTMLLAFDTATDRLGVVLADGDRVVAESATQLERRQTEALTPMIDLLLSQAGVGLGDLKAIGVAIGPGSFNGVRAGLATAKGLCAALGLPLVGVDTLSLSVWPYRDCGRPLYAVSPIGRSRYAGRWTIDAADSGNARNGPVDGPLTIEDIRRRVGAGAQICGEIAPPDHAELARRLDPSVSLPPAPQARRQPAALAALCQWRLAQCGPDNLDALEPIYIGVGPTPGATIGRSG